MMQENAVVEKIRENMASRGLTPNALQMDAQQLDFADDGTVMVTTVTGGAEGQYVYRYTFADNTVELTTDDGTVPVLPASGTYDTETDTLRLFTSDDGRTCVYIRTPDLVGKWTLKRVETITESTTLFGMETSKWGDVTDQIEYESWLEFTADGHVYYTMYFPDMGEALHDSATYTVSGNTIKTEWSTASEPGAEKDVKLSYDAENDTICLEGHGIRREYYARTPKAQIPAGERKEIAVLREKYPEYFGLDTSKGLKVYVWQMAEPSYSCALISGTDGRSETEIGIQSKGATIEEMRLILSTYELEEKEIEVVPFHNPISSYWYEIDKAYTARVKWLLLDTPIEDGGDLLHAAPIAAAVYDVDGDGRLETCVLTDGPTSGFFTVVFSVYRNGTLVARNSFLPDGAPTFVRAEDGLLVRLTETDWGPVYTSKLYRVSIENGAIVLTDEETGETMEYWGLADPHWNMN